jgi:hypothetical protein
MAVVDEEVPPSEVSLALDLSSSAAKPDGPAINAGNAR